MNALYIIYTPFTDLRVDIISSDLNLLLGYSFTCLVTNRSTSFLLLTIHSDILKTRGGANLCCIVANANFV